MPAKRSHQTTHAREPWEVPETPAQRRYSEELERRNAKTNRLLCNLFGFWEQCSQGQCRRRRECLGDATACFNSQWLALPEQDKAFGRGSVKALIGGEREVEGLIAAGDEEAARAAALQAELDEMRRGRE